MTDGNMNDMRERCAEFAAQNFRSGLNCSESVYNALLRAGLLGDTDPATQAMCVGFGGGIGLSGRTCGALSALVMANGAVYGRRDPYSVPEEIRGTEIADKYYRRYNNIVRDFEREFGSTLCREITGGVDEWHSEQRRKKCMKLVIRAAKMGFDYLGMTNEEAFAMPYAENMGGRE